MLITARIDNHDMHYIHFYYENNYAFSLFIDIFCDLMDDTENLDKVLDLINYNGCVSFKLELVKQGR